MRKQIDVMPLVEVVDALLAPDGCPWDRAQSHESCLLYTSPSPRD